MCKIRMFSCKTDLISRITKVTVQSCACAIVLWFAHAWVHGQNSDHMTRHMGPNTTGHMTGTTVDYVTAGSDHVSPDDVIQVSGAPYNLTVSEFLDTLLEADNYDPRVRPDADNGEPTAVTVDVFVNSLSSVDEVRMEYTINIFLRQSWQDNRLAHSRYKRDLVLNYNQLSRIWVPDLFIPNEKDARFHDITVPNILIRLSPDGTILYSQRISAQLACIMSLKKYPMDDQTCYIKFESYGYTTDDITLAWKNVSDPIQIPTSIELPEFALGENLHGDCTVEYATGSFPCIYGSIKLYRQFSYYLIQTYIPSMLIVILSWVSFWIDNESVPARITLGLLTVLTMTTQSSGINSRLPRVSYVKAIDVWMSTCLVFVFGALIEYSIVNVLARKYYNSTYPPHVDTDNRGYRRRTLRGASIRTRPITNVYYVTGEGVGVANGTLRQRQQATDEENHKDKEGATEPMCVGVKDKALMVDVVSRVLFPITFLLFNAGYWITYLYLL